MMPLPKIDVPIYDTTLPSGTEIQYRGFLVKEEKLFLLAAEAKDSETIITTIKQIISNCVITGPPIDDLPVFDIEYLLLQIRARSVGEKVNVRYKCNATITKEDGSQKICEKMSDYEYDLLNFAPTRSPDHTDTIMLTNTIGVVMNYPSFGKFSKALTSKFTSDDAFALVARSINRIFDENTTHYTKDIPLNEIADFIETLTPPQLKKLDKFFDTAPKNIISINFHCPACNHKDVITLKGLESFFV